MPLKSFDNDSEDSQFALERQRAARVMRRKFKTAEVIRCQIVSLPDAVTAQVLTPQQTYRYVRRPENTTFAIGSYVSVLNPGGESSGKLWEIINLPNTYGGASGVTSLNSRTGALDIVAGDGITVSTPTPSTIRVSAIPVEQFLTTYNTYGTYNTYQTYQTYQTYNTYGTVGGVAYSYGIIGATFDGAGYQITTGFVSYLRVPVGGTAIKWSMMADKANTYMQVDFWKTSFALFPPVDANSMTGSDVPRLINQATRESVALTGWNTQINDGDVIGIFVDSVTYATKATVEIEYRKNL